MKDNITIIDDRWIEGNLFTQFTEIENANKNLINVKKEKKKHLSIFWGNWGYQEMNDIKRSIIWVQI